MFHSLENFISATRKLIARRDGREGGAETIPTGSTQAEPRRPACAIRFSIGQYSTGVGHAALTNPSGASPIPGRVSVPQP
jgi:hypothetical protein